MKKLFLTLIMAVALFTTAYADGKPITFEQLPANAQTVITQNFVKENILIIILDKEVFSTEYEVKFNDGKELKFNKNGELIKIDYKLERVPDNFIPEQVLTHVQSNFPNAFIKEWKYDDGQWKAELNNNLELIFNKNYQFVGIDD